MISFQLIRPKDRYRKTPLRATVPKPKIGLKKIHPKKTTIKVAGIVTYTATYTLTAAPALSGKIRNTVLATASSPGNTANVIDVSDDGDDSDSNTINDQTEVSTTAQTSINVTKSAVVSQTNGNSTTEAGDVITYTIGIKNTGDVNLTGLTLTDTLITKISYRHVEESNWLNWISDNLLATYDKEQLVI